MATQSISRREWLTVLAITLVLIAITILPYWLGYRTAPEGMIFSGTIMNPEDSQTYFAKMLQGFDGKWLYSIVFTPEPHNPIFLGSFYFLLGHIARLTTLSLDGVWHLSRTIAVFMLSFTTYWFIAWFLNAQKTRMVAYLLAIFGSGLGWLLFVLGQSYWLDWFPVDFKMPAAHLFFSLLTFPHIIYSTALLLISFRLLLQAMDNPDSQKSWLYAIGASVANLLITLLHPLLTYLFVLVGVLFWVYLVFRARRFLWREGFLLVVYFALPGLMSLYYGYSLLTNDILRGWDAQRESTISPPWPHYLMAYGPLLLFTFIHWWNGRRKEIKRPFTWSFLWIWMLAVALLVYAPLNSQRRFIQGVHVPLSILAAIGFMDVALPWLLKTRPFQAILSHPRYTSKKLSQFITAIFLLLMSLSSLYTVTSVVVSNSTLHPDLIFVPQDDKTATIWLRDNGENADVLLGDYQSGNYVAARAGNRVVLGHWAETINYDTKVAEVAHFFDEQTDDLWRQELLEQYDVSYIWHGPREKELGGFDPETAVYLQPLYANDTITIYTVTNP